MHLEPVAEGRLDLIEPDGGRVDVRAAVVVVDVEFDRIAHGRSSLLVRRLSFG
jgi:hypothetical protein